MNVWKSFIYSLFSPTMIGRFRMQKIGRTILYVFLLVLITNIPAAISISSFAVTAGDRLQHVLAEDIPDYEVETGALAVEGEEMPYTTQIDDTLVILDDSGHLNPEDFADDEDVTALLEDRAFMVANGEMEQMEYGSFSFTKAELQEATGSFLELLPAFIALILILLYLFASGMKFIGVFAISGIGLLLKKIYPARLQYRHIWVMSAYIATLPTVIGTILDVIGRNGDFSFWIYWLLVIGVSIIVFRTLPKPKPRPSHV
ncbi:DUF1189 domain-containing protein [Natribacillus halophilus]|uniref:Maltodextrin utilization protein YvdJ n=1 Tax=Natribacillus halophilus TaxID=549003 RepID=A0A1G8JPG2_9BACI|nr:DUF1189 domain-containing protein [Natribacillus halophilus]SDI32991.1 Protein of unknown function [Natribacillus halophilus]